MGRQTVVNWTRVCSLQNNQGSHRIHFTHSMIAKINVDACRNTVTQKLTVFLSLTADSLRLLHDRLHKVQRNNVYSRSVGTLNTDLLCFRTGMSWNSSDINSKLPRKVELCVSTHNTGCTRRVREETDSFCLKSTKQLVW